MSEEVDNKSYRTESDEEDYESFFLQPAPLPYNIKDKLIEANGLLLQESCDSSREYRVKFKETLVEYEPDMTDDDVQSIESYNEIEYPIEYSNEIKNENQSLYTADNHAIFNIEEVEEDIEEKCEAVYEVVEGNFIDDEIDEKFENYVEDVEDKIEENIEDIEETVDEVIESIDLSEVEDLKESNSSESSKVVSQKSKRKSSKNHLPFEINCRKHCIERFETNLEFRISRLRLTEKPPCPSLRLHRKCCGGGDINSRRLPVYTGLRSEYGLSSTQLDRLQKRKEVIRLREQKRHELRDEHKKRIAQQNEEIFKEWLRDVNNRGIVENRRRPKTAGYVGKTDANKNYIAIRPRPKTCLLIQLAEDVDADSIRKQGQRLFSFS